MGEMSRSQTLVLGREGGVGQGRAGERGGEGRGRSGKASKQMRMNQCPSGNVTEKNVMEG